MAQAAGQDTRWRVWSAEETARKVATVEWVGSGRGGLAGAGERSWEALAAAGESLGETWAPFLAQTNDLMQAWIGVIEDQQEKVAFLWGYHGRRGQSLEEAMAEGLSPLRNSMRCFGRPLEGWEGWIFKAPENIIMRDVEPLANALKAVEQEDAARLVVRVAKASWERVELRRQVEAARIDAPETPARAPKRV
jgi:hypothetical protein